ncbi:SAM-dependent methyltransferase [Flammeovirgaceae bacterium SG7u.111]|nr:SAM-dependent methyltransferase [Flammeovirgaceae bacterium SG7u.132]WPO34722.1 SAM-dependent methyltransferase [Flammeovirgaceae bacterium SG7u.111]
MKLFLIPSPLADTNLNWVSPQLREAVSSCDYYLVEKEKTARRFLGSLSIKESIRDLNFFVLDKKTKLREIELFFNKIPTTENVGVISEAGCPGIADPGAMAVEYAHKKGIEVEPIVGPSSIFLALMSSGLSGQRFVFHGYLPIDKSKRLAYIKKMEQASVRNRETQIFMETPYRNNHLMTDLIATCQIDTKICIAANIHHPDQMIKTKTVNGWKKTTVELHKKPTIFLIMA